VPVPAEPAAPTERDRRAVVDQLIGWYDRNGRDLPWRRPEATPWQIMISEYMLQQTPVARVLRPWQEWVERWPSAPALAAAPSGEAVRAWGRLGYPRRALRLHAAATAITERHDGQVPASHAALLALPGVGSYTAAAIASFAFRQRHVVLDTNVRRVLTRIDAGQPQPAASLSAAEVVRAESYLPRSGPKAARWAVASMELGALVCTARAPRCGDCPVRRRCRWLLRGRPVPDGPPRRGQSYAGTDRQCRGALLAVLRSSDAPVPAPELAQAWPDAAQRSRCLGSLEADGLLVRHADDYSLPH
jgi:A/G-specific adenine glycosylase